MNKLLIAAIVLFMVLSLASAQNLFALMSNTTTNSDISTVVNNITSFAPALQTILQTQTNLTFVAPLNSAFNFTVLNTSVYADRNTTLFYHAGNVQLTQQSVEANYPTFAAGLTVKVNNYTAAAASSLGLASVLTINGVPLAAQVQNATNGFLAKINSVLYPPMNSTYDTVNRLMNFTDAQNFLSRASTSIQNLLRTANGVLFVPTNAAFQSFNVTLGQAGTSLAALNQSTVDAFWRNFLVNTSFTTFSPSFPSGTVTLNSNYQANGLNVTRNGLSISVSSLGNLPGGAVVNADLVTTNGAIFCVNAVLQPSGFFPSPTFAPTPTPGPTTNPTPAPTPAPNNATTMKVSLLFAAVIVLLFNFF